MLTTVEILFKAAWGANTKSNIANLQLSSVPVESLKVAFCESGVE